MNELFTENMNYMNLPHKVFKYLGFFFFLNEKMNRYVRIKVEKWFNTEHRDAFPMNPSLLFNLHFEGSLG